MAVPAFAEKFVSIDGATSYTFGKNQMVASITQPMRTPMSVGIGADFPHDFLGYGVAPRDAAIITISWITSLATAALVDTETDSIRSKLLLIGKGKLYLLMADGSERWIYARASSMPVRARGNSEFTHAPQAVAMLGFGNWRATSPATGTQAISTQGTQSFTITNAGNVYVRDGTFRLRANAWHGFVTPLIRNATTGEVICSSRQAENADSEIKIDCSAQSVYWSNNDGAAYTDDYSRVLRGPMQAGLFSLAPGANTIVVCGGDLWPLLSLTNPATQDASFEWSYDTPWA